MTYHEAMRQLKALGTAQNRKVYGRHGASVSMFGVSYANLGKLRKKIKRDHGLAVELWATGNHDARVLATMIADPSLLKPAIAEAWVKDLGNHGIAGAFAGLIARTAFVQDKIGKWTGSNDEWIGCAGWTSLANLALSDSTLPDAFFDPHLATIETDIHHRKNRVRYAMNSALIAIGLRNKRLQTRALTIASRIGKVEVDHGQTGCKTPDAAEYIRKATRRKESDA